MRLAQTSKLMIRSVFLTAIVLLATTTSFARDKFETIEAQAMGSGVQLGRNMGVSLNIYQYSTPADRQVLIDAFNKGQNHGLSSALSKMKAVGHVEVTGTLGSDCSFIRMIPTPTGRKIIFVTNRQIRFGEAWSDSNSMSYDLTAGILEINDQDKSKSKGTLFPAAELVVNKKGELQWDLLQNPWNLVDILDWKGTAGVN